MVLNLERSHKDRLLASSARMTCIMRLNPWFQCCNPRDGPSVEYTKVKVKVV